MGRELVAALALLWISAGCEQGACARHSDCDVGQVCTVEGVCAARPDAGAPVDGAPTDAVADAVTDAVTDAPTDAPPDAPMLDGGP